MRGVPTSFLGYSVMQGPKVLRYLFLIDLPSPVYEADLVASHLREFRAAAHEQGIACDALDEYVCTPEAVRAFRVSVAAECGGSVQPTDVKKLMNAIAYGSSGEQWKTDVGADLPLKAMQEGPPSGGGGAPSGGVQYYKHKYCCVFISIA